VCFSESQSTVRQLRAQLDDLQSAAGSDGERDERARQMHTKCEQLTTEVEKLRTQLNDVTGRFVALTAGNRIYSILIIITYIYSEHERIQHALSTLPSLQSTSSTSPTDPRDIALQQARTVIATQDAELARAHSESEHPLSKREFDTIVAERDSLQAQVTRLIVCLEGIGGLWVCVCLLQEESERKEMLAEQENRLVATAYAKQVCVCEITLYSYTLKSLQLHRLTADQQQQQNAVLDMSDSLSTSTLSRQRTVASKSRGTNALSQSGGAGHR
jgi:hypothetical protein